MIELGSFRNTTSLEVTSEAVFFTSPGPHSIYVVVADRNVKLMRNGGDVKALGFPLKEGVCARLRLEKNEVLTILLADGETDGFIHITEAS